MLVGKSVVGFAGHASYVVGTHKCVRLCGLNCFTPFLPPLAFGGGLYNCAVSFESRHRMGTMNRSMLKFTLLLLAVVTSGCAHSTKWDRKIGADASRELA